MPSSFEQYVFVYLIIIYVYFALICFYVNLCKELTVLPPTSINENRSTYSAAIQTILTTNPNHFAFLSLSLAA